MPATYVPKPNATVEDWIGSYVDRGSDDLSSKRASVSIKAVSGDTVHIELSDAGQQGGSTSDPLAFRLPIPPLDITTDVDLNKFKVPIEPDVVLNTVALDSDQVVLTLMVLVTSPKFGLGDTKFIKYQRKIHDSQFLTTTIDLYAAVPPEPPPR